MTVMMASPRAKAGATPVKAAGARGAKPVPPAAAPPGPRRRQIALTPMRSETAKSLRKLAAHVQGSHPDMSVHQHLRDAARVLESGNEEGAQRHLRAAMFALTPQSLLRNGVHDDAGHLAAREVMHGAHRHLLLVKDIVDAGEKNRAAIARDSYGDLQSAPSLPSSPVHADPNAGYGPGALAQKPTARQPGGDRALNAPARTNSGGSDPAVADPVGPQPRGSKQFARSWDEVSCVIEMAATMTKEQAHYRPGGVPGHRCGDCTMIRGDRCTLVEGLIDPGHVCDHFDAAGASLAWGWDDLASVAASVVELSAKTAALEVTPAPRGKPGGPGLYDVKDLQHTPYFQNVVKALIEKRGMPPGKAYAIAYGALRKWSRGGGHVHGEVRAAATGALAGEKAKGAMAKAIHGHATSRDEAAVELARRSELRNKRGEWASGMDALAGVMSKDRRVSPQAVSHARHAARAMRDGNHSGARNAALAAAEEVHGVNTAGYAKRLTAHAKSAAGAGVALAASWDDVASVIEMAAAAAVPGQQIAAGQPATAASQPVSPARSANATAQPRVTAGSPAGGQFAPPGSGSGGGGKQPLDAHQQHVAHLQHLATHGTPAQQQAAKALLARMSAGSGKTAASKPAAPKATTAPKTTAKTTAPAKSTAKASTSKASTSKTTTGKTATSAAKATSSKTASTKAKVTAHQAHAAHVAHLQHLATHGNPAQQKAAAAVLARMGVKV